MFVPLFVSSLEPTGARFISKTLPEITHRQVYGPAVVCDWQDDWSALDANAQAGKMSRQGVRYPVLDGLMVADPETMEPISRDGKTIGEIFMKGNIVMKGFVYLCIFYATNCLGIPVL